VKRLPQPPIWLPGVLHLAHGLIAGGVGYMLAYAATLWQHSEPHSARATGAMVASIALAVFEVSFVV
jgi:hypothetical protein